MRFATAIAALIVLAPSMAGAESLLDLASATARLRRKERRRHGGSNAQGRGRHCRSSSSSRRHHGQR